MSSTEIKLAETPDFDLGGLRVSPPRRWVASNGNGRELEPRVAQVLVALALARPQVISRDRLIDQCWGGRIVGDDALNRCIVALRHLAKDFSPEPFKIETVPRVGYRLVEGNVDGPAKRRGRPAVILVGALLLFILLGLGAAWYSGVQRFGNAAQSPAAIAVLPFRNLSAGDPYFAEGIAEEILGELAREPQFRVVGSTSSMQLGSTPNVREAARKLNVEYLVEGSVRRQGNQVRVDAGLLRAKDGVLLWSDTYNGKLDNIFAIQRQIGTSIAKALQRRLVRAPALTGPLVTNGEAYNLYLTARGLIRTRNRRVTSTAAGLLRDAINIDPHYAPAWASLAEATSLEDRTDRHESLVTALSRAQVYARRALELAPDFADAHRILGLVLVAGSPESQAHLRRAAQLNPNSAENMLALGNALANEGEFDQELEAYRRAGQLDPLWFRTTGAQAIALARRGQRSEAEAIARRGLAKDANNQHILLGRIAWLLGDYSESARHWSIVARGNSPRWSSRAGEDLINIAAVLGVGKIPVRRVGGALQERLSIEPPPAFDDWKQHNRDATTTGVYADENEVTAKAMLNDGKAKTIVSAYDQTNGLLRISRGRSLRVDQLRQAPIVALVLRQSGRSAEADRLLHQANNIVRAVYRRNRTVPFAFDADAAAIWAAQGHTGEALAGLERAVHRGWTHAGSADLPNVVDEPAFRSLRGQPRFERIVATIAAHLVRERAETQDLGQ